MSASTQDVTVEQLQVRIQELEGMVQQLTNQAKAKPSVSTMVVKMKPKKPEPYNGKGNPQTFLTQARVYLRFLSLEEPADQILAVGACLTGDAADWFEPMMRDYLGRAEADREK